MEFKVGKKIEVGYEEPKTDPFGLLGFRIQMVEEGCDRCKDHLTIEELMSLAKTHKFEEDGREPNLAHMCRDCYRDFLHYFPKIFKQGK